MLTGLLVLFGAASSNAQPAIRQVLVLQSFARGNLILDHISGNFRVDLEERLGSAVNIVELVVSPTGLVGAPEQKIVDYIRANFADQHNPDLIVAFAGPATVFARKHRQQLFPETPILFAAVDQRYLRDAPLADNEAAVTVASDFAGVVDDILKLRPQTRQVFMVMGSGSLGKFWRRELEIDTKRFQDRLSFVWSDEMSLQEILRRCAQLPKDSAIFYLTFSTDAAGGTYPDTRVLADLRAVANAPMFVAMSVFISHGVVGGTVIQVDELARNSADVAIRLLNGAPTKSINVPPQMPGPPVFDWRELRRWEIPESRLAPGSVVLFRGPSLWSEYRAEVLTAAVVLSVQSLLIAGLLYERRARRRAETDSRRNLALAADAGRRQTMSALTNSITHELGQPLSAMIQNAKALQMMVVANRASAETIGEIVSDIQRQGVQATQIIDRHRAMLRGHQLDKQSIDLHTVISESLAMVAHDLRSRGIEGTVEMSPDPCVITGDQVLLRQVLVNLVVNAADAMAATPPGKRHVMVRSECQAATVRISVADAGTGLPPQLEGKLFAPFMTTKSQGLGIGLTIVRTIVDAHDGTIEAHNNPDGGATFTVTLPRGDAAAMLSAPEGAA